MKSIDCWDLPSSSNWSNKTREMHELPDKHRHTLLRLSTLGKTTEFNKLKLFSISKPFHRTPPQVFRGLCMSSERG